MAYLSLIIAWAIVIFPWGFFAYSFYKALDNCSKGWLITTIAAILLMPLYYVLLHQLALDLIR